MTFVGPGGSYAVETQYKYVGSGAGEFAYVTPTKSNFALFCTVGVVVLVLIVVIIVLMPWPTSTTTASPPLGPPSDCLLWGDPHVETFDHGFANFYEEGEYHLVKTSEVNIQARFLATPFTNGLSATHEVAVGGKFIGGNKIVVGPMENGQITFNGQPILQAFPAAYSERSSGIVLMYNDQGKLVDNAMGHLEKHIVHMDLPLGVHLQVMRWANHLNVRITMAPRAGGQDGLCGNFNGNVFDDSTLAIKARIGERVAPSELLFNHPAQVGPSRSIRTIADCEQTKRTKAMALCMADQPQVTGKQLVESCVFDVCFGGEQYAGEDGLAESQG